MSMFTDMSPAGLIVSLIASSIGFALFVYGKKQRRPPQLVAGALLMGLPVIVPDPLWMGVTSAAALGGNWFAVRAGW